jgi:hypothetical protein
MIVDYKYIRLDVFDNIIAEATKQSLDAWRVDAEKLSEMIKQGIISTGRRVDDLEVYADGRDWLIHIGIPETLDRITLSRSFVEERSASDVIDSIISLYDSVVGMQERRQGEWI